MTQPQVTIPSAKAKYLADAYLERTLALKQAKFEKLIASYLKHRPLKRLFRLTYRTREEAIALAHADDEWQYIVSTSGHWIRRAEQLSRMNTKVVQEVTLSVHLLNVLEGTN